MTASSTVLLFEKGSDPVILEEGGCKYAAGKLTMVGRHTVKGHLSRIDKYLKESWGYTVDKASESTLEASSVAEFLYSNEAIVILTSDYTSELKPAELLEWPETFFDKCFAAAIELNPKLLPSNR